MPDAYTRDTMPAVPAGTIRRADYGTFDRSLYADRTELDSAVGAIHRFPTVRLTHHTRGYCPAGSCAVWREERWSVLWMDDVHNTQHGSSYLTEAEARARFLAVTDPATVAEKRAEAERLEREVYAPARAERERAAAAFAAEKKAREAARRKARRAKA